jgi:predicted nucleotide-binding protein
MDKLIAELTSELNKITEGPFVIHDMDDILARCRMIMKEVFGEKSKEAGIVDRTFLPPNGVLYLDDDITVKNFAIAGLRQTISYLKGKRDAAQFRDVIANSNVQTQVEGYSATGKVFVIHGHNDAVREAIARFVEKLGLEAIILFERSNGGKTIIEKFERESNVGFAIALLTADDVATCNRDKKEEMRARQNVVFELGYFVAKLGRGRVAVLKESGVAEPSDLHGIVYTEIDSRGAWKLELAKELKAAGFAIDMNKVV